MDQADVDDGKKEAGPATNPGASKLRRENRVLAMENEILKRAAAYFATENVLPQ